MAGRKTKIETILNDGSKILIVINGSNPQKIMKFMKLLQEFENIEYKENYQVDTTSLENSIYMKIYDLIKYEFGRAGFTLNDIYRAYIIKYNDDSIKKNTVSTYLSRMVDEGVLERNGRRGKYVYRYVEIENNIRSLSLF